MQSVMGFSVDRDPGGLEQSSAMRASESAGEIKEEPDEDLEKGSRMFHDPARGNRVLLDATVAGSRGEPRPCGETAFVHALRIRAGPPARALAERPPAFRLQHPGQPAGRVPRHAARLA